MSADTIAQANVKSIQLEKLQAGVEEVLASNAFYQSRLHKVDTWSDFFDLPFLTKAELVEDQKNNLPFGTNLTYPLGDYVRLHQTSGSSGGRPLRWLDTARSWLWWTGLWANHVYKAAGITSEDRIFFAFSFGPFVGFWSAYAGAERLGAMVIPGGSMSSEQRVLAIRDLEPTVLCSTPTYALRLGEVANEMGIDLSKSSIRKTLHAGEPGASIPATKRSIETMYGAQVYDHTGMTELGPTGFTCSAGDGVHFIESEFIFEVIPLGSDPESNITQSEGKGELVVTNLGRFCSPLIRYRTGDLVDLSREPCSCGSPFVKSLGGIQGRVDDMFTVRGINLYPSQVEEVLMRYSEIVNFQIRHQKVRQMDEVALLIETRDGTEEVVERVVLDLRHSFGVRIDCKSVPIGSLPREEMKAKRVVHVEG
ncbi:MAG: phenylacetate--CoA ligase family protein [Actinomycetota bacterium]|nr:MAG: phenylacetate--CoA ligase family protein [Actinomycetota bacterium]